MQPLRAGDGILNYAKGQFGTLEILVTLVGQSQPTAQEVGPTGTGSLALFSRSVGIILVGTKRLGSNGKLDRRPQRSKPLADSARNWPPCDNAD